MSFGCCSSSRLWETTFKENHRNDKKKDVLVDDRKFLLTDLALQDDAPFKLRSSSTPCCLLRFFSCLEAPFARVWLFQYRDFRWEWYHRKNTVSVLLYKKLCVRKPSHQGWQIAFGCLRLQFSYRAWRRITTRSVTFSRLEKTIVVTQTKLSCMILFLIFCAGKRTKWIQGVQVSLRVSLFSLIFPGS